MYKVKLADMVIDRRKSTRRVSTGIGHADAAFIFGCVVGALVSSALWMAVAQW